MALAVGQVAGPTTLVTTTETTVVSTPSVPITPTGQASTQPGTQGVIIRGSFNFQSGTAGTGATVRCRVGSVTGAIVGQFGITNPAGNTIEVPFNFEDSIYSDAAAGYFITVQQIAATGNGIANLAVAEVDIAVP